MFHCETGSATKNIMQALLHEGIHFYYSNYMDKWMEIDEKTGKEKYSKKKIMFSKFVIRIDEFQDKSPELYSQLMEMEVLVKGIVQNLIETDRVHEFFFN
jgi:hypothetical protein